MTGRIGAAVSGAANNRRNGILLAVAASVCFSLNDAATKFLSSDYALHQVILIRSLIGMTVMLLVFVPFEGGYHLLRTRRLPLHLLRAAMVILSNVTYFLGLAALPLADATALFFVAPLAITAFSVLMLGEKVGLRRWAAVGLGMVGVLVMLRPGGEAFQPISVLPLIAACCYAMLHMLTRRLSDTERAATMGFYVQLSFIVTSGLIGLVLGDGRLAGLGGPTLEFLTRSWVMPAMRDLPIFAMVGVVSALGVYFITQAYRLSEANLIAPFEYVAMPFAILWGVTVFAEWPDLWSWVGMALIVGAGLDVFLREARTGPR